MKSETSRAEPRYSLVPTYDHAEASKTLLGLSQGFFVLLTSFVRQELSFSHGADAGVLSQGCAMTGALNGPSPQVNMKR